MHPTMDQTEEEKKTLATDNPAESAPDADDIIAKYEEMFATRYTEEDPAYLPYINKGMDLPPIVENYSMRRQRPNWNDNRSDSRQYQDRGRKRNFDDASHHEDWKRRRGHHDNRSYHHDQGGGWGHQQHRGHGGENRWGHQPRQDQRARDDRGYQRDQSGRWYDNERGRSSGPYEARQRSHQPQDHEWT
ncbi:RNA guanine-N7 methyltransferase activating subunit-like [Patiria miniata]|uniref:Uncharacterized protein n=1 Tax=Patiria miniata TaxID=46514 RepID=A0A914A3Q4_PATMI|nr:RNA guanine-N7 methyltransferase activating subunit-like [Patiria miniata]XP_038058300.1 RNA guanine-N7 methyltransferase activating subunit-like [Patiria miniata]XP_038058301.1 RNA guanine-N7 methyltransferase activating subunit-like [Patiria miniata]XP_038058302.1 RNA guanine-N7 methyltransferase activating subunit-like [Patiria miniata]